MTSEIFEYRGCDNLVYAEVITDTEEKYETGEVKPLAGIAEISKKTETSNAPHYYNNVPAIVISSTGSDEITLNVSALTLETLGDITGQKFDVDTGALIEGERKVKYFAVGYVTKKTNGDEVYVWRYKGTFSIPDSNHITEDEGTEANGQELAYTGISTTHKFTKTGARARAINVDLGADKADVSAFFDTVTTPDTLKAKTTP